MPIYEYRCQDCGTQFEKLVRKSGDAPECPSCGRKHLTQEFSTFAAVSGGKKAAEMPSCAGGVCRTPDVCGMN
ncbi:MAG: zinc ribbon domain-containing protein [Acidobacteria bacterium]|nr:zinc ribbon domain-containing protein [Acidobacteriota bacterium]